jgi:transcriptional regulator with XRE-family HTH domain
MDRKGFCIRLKEIRGHLKLNQKNFSEMLGIRQNYLSRYENGEYEVADELKLQILKIIYQNYKKRINLDWLLTGEGLMFLSEEPIHEIIEIENKNGIINVGNVGDANEIVMQEENHGTILIHSSDIGEKTATRMVFEIPLLTKEQVLQFEPTKEIPSPNAYSGKYPDYTLVSIPWRLQEYGTDLRAIVVFNNMMTPILSPGNVAIFQATGWNGNGIYIYRMSGDLHISHIHFEGKNKNYHLIKEFEPEEKIPYDAESFVAIGRVRAVVREIE